MLGLNSMRMVLVLVLGGCVAMGALACAAADETGQSATEASESSATATAGDGCEGGPSCGSNEQCGHASTVCSCDAAFEYCTTSESPGGCVETPAACSDLSAEALEQCLSDQWCDGAPGSFVEGAFECIAIDECHGDCDLNPEGCMDTGPGPMTCGTAPCEGSDVCVKPGDDCQCDDGFEYCDYVDQPEACQSIPNDRVGRGRLGTGRVFGRRCARHIGAARVRCHRGGIGLGRPVRRALVPAGAAASRRLDGRVTARRSGDEHDQFRQARHTARAWLEATADHPLAGSCT